MAVSSVVVPVAAKVVTKSVNSGQGGLDPDALAYFAAVEAAGGSFDLSSINATYTQSYVKRAHSNLFFGLKRDGLWDKLTELYLLCGKTFGGLTVKAKGTGALTNVNFVTGDWVGAGSGCGLKGNGSTKYLQTSFNPSLTLSVDDCSLFAYNTQVSTTSNKQIFGSYIGTNTSFFIRSSQQGDSTDFSLTKHDGGDNGTRTGFTLGTRSSTNKTGYSNGSAIQILSSTGGAIPDLDIVVFGINYVGYKGSYDGRLTVAGTGKGLTPPEAANLSTRFNAFMTSLGGNVYGPPADAEPESLAYFDAVEAAGGSFDLSSINATYTDAYVKQAHDTLFKGLKADGLWTKLTELYLLCGKTFGGLTVKAKGTGALTNVNFVTGDWVGAGSGCGLVGNGSTKSIRCNLVAASLDANSYSHSVYITSLGLIDGNCSDFSITTDYDIYKTASNIILRQGDLAAYPTAGAGFFIGTKTNSTTSKGYANGVPVTAFQGTSAGFAVGSEATLFARRTAGVVGVWADSRMTVAHYGTGLTDTDAANLSTRVNAFMTSLGGNVY